MTNSISTKDYPVKYFKEFFLDGGYAKYRDKFLSYCAQMHKKSPNSVHVSFDDIEIRIDIPEENSIGESSIESTFFTDDLFRDLKNEVEVSKSLLRDAQVENFKDIDNFINSQRVILRDINENNKNLFDNLPELKKIIEVLDNYIVNLKLTQKQKEIFTLTKRIRPVTIKTFNDDDIIQNPFFAKKDVKVNFLKWLYGKLIDYGIIAEFDNYEDGEYQFIEIFSSVKPQDLDYCIRFEKDNEDVVLVLEELKKRFFNNLRPVTIEKSGRFLNQQKRIFKADVYHTIKSGSKNKPLEEYDNEVRQFLIDLESYNPTNLKSKKS